MRPLSYTALARNGLVDAAVERFAIQSGPTLLVEKVLRAPRAAGLRIDDRQVTESWAFARLAPAVSSK
jgi:hypothetical protein